VRRQATRNGDQKSEIRSQRSEVGRLTAEVAENAEKETEKKWILTKSSELCVLCVLCGKISESGKALTAESPEYAEFGEQLE
jgi:hypothetical protein